MNINIDRLDMILANLKPLEPSPAFDAEFKRKLSEAAAKRLEETAFDRALRMLREGAYELRGLLLPKRLVLARVAVMALLLISAGLYYSRPSCPIMTGQVGLIMVQRPGESVPRQIKLAQSLRTGETIITREGEQADISLDNKYAIRIKGSSRLKVAKLTPRYGKGVARFQLLDGCALVSVESGFKGSRFIMDTGSARAIALGTKFRVEASGEELRTEVGVLQGKVVVEGYSSPDKIFSRKQSVIVGSGQKTEVTQGRMPTKPARLAEDEWLQMEELYQIGRKPQVVLLVKNTPDRAKQLLAPCPIYISDELPRELPKSMEDAVLKIAYAVKTKDFAKHLESVKMLEKIAEESRDTRYSVQLLLYVGAYYEYLGLHDNAIAVFKEVLLRHSDSPLASIAAAAIGIIDEEKLGDPKAANEAYSLVLMKYPNSLEAIWVEEKLGIKKVI